MDPVHRNQLLLLLLGVFLGIFIRPRIIAIAFAICFIAAIIGLFVVKGDQAMLFGVVGMAIPVLGAITVIGAIVGARLRLLIRNRWFR